LFFAIDRSLVFPPSQLRFQNGLLSVPTARLSKFVFGHFVNHKICVRAVLAC